MTEEETKIKATLEDEDEEVNIIDFSKPAAAGAGKKKKKKKAKVSGAETEQKKAAVQLETTAFSLKDVEGHTNYDYSFLLDRIEELMNSKNATGETEMEGTKEEMPVTRFISTRTSVQNFESLRTKINRPDTHILDFFKVELDVEGIIGPEGNMILSGKYQNKHINNLYKQYLSEFVRCHDCRKLQTIMDRDKNTRLQTLTCTICGSHRNLPKIAARFHATKRGERRAAKQQLA